MFGLDKLVKIQKQQLRESGIPAKVRTVVFLTDQVRLEVGRD